MNNKILFRLGAANACAWFALACAEENHDRPSSIEAPHDAGTDSGAAAENAQPPLDRTAIAGLDAQHWNWVPFEDAHCRDGSSTGLGVNPNPDSSELMIFLEGGGACFNELTCAMNPAQFDADAFTKFSQARGLAGIFNRDNESNPLRNWNFVYVPYCTGDTHGGSNPAGEVANVEGVQEFVGYRNVSRFLARIMPTFEHATKVLLTGQSAGGFGAVANYVQVAHAFASVPVYNLDDSGPPLQAPFGPTCLTDLLSDTWNFAGLIAACGTSCDPMHFHLLDLWRKAAKDYPDATFGYLGDTADSELRTFLGFGDDDCAPMNGFSVIDSARYRAGVEDLRARLQEQPNMGTFIFDDMVHTTLTTDAAYKALHVGDVQLHDWIARLVDGQATNVGP